MLSQKQIDKCIELDKQSNYLKVDKEVKDDIVKEVLTKRYSRKTKSRKLTDSYNKGNKRVISDHPLTADEKKLRAKEYHAKWYQAHKAEVDAKHYEYMKTNPEQAEKLLQRNRKYYAENKEERALYRKEYYQNNTEYFKKKSHEQYLRRKVGKYL